MSDPHHANLPTREEIVESLLAPAGSPERVRIEALASTNEACGQMVRAVRGTLNALEAARLTEVPADMRRRGADIFDSYFASIGQRPGAFIAELLSDSRTGQFTQGLRGVSSAYRLSFTLFGATLDVQITEVEARPGTDEGGLWRLRARIDNPEVLRGATVTARHVLGAKSAEAASTTCDDSGHFVLKVPSGLYDLEIAGPAGRAVLQGIEVG